MATGKKRPKKAVGARLKIRQKTKNGGKKFSVKPSSAVLLKKKKQKELADPLGIPLPANFLSYDTCRHIMVLRKTQYKLWSWAIVLALLLLFSVTGIELLMDFHIIGTASQQYATMLSHASLLAIFVIGMELASSFALAKNKMLFLTNNWLMILAIIPAGLLARAGAGVFELFEAAASFRAFQLAGKIGELGSIIPNLQLPALRLSPALLDGIGEVFDSAKIFVFRFVLRR